ncbi:MAG: carbohydrate transporter substrate-binding protein family [Herbinix sp.]|nr:carbohydrate transporter substrate-binding protein family [Herbinix sp.]
MKDMKIFTKNRIIGFLLILVLINSMIKVTYADNINSQELEAATDQSDNDVEKDDNLFFIEKTYAQYLSEHEETNEASKISIDIVKYSDSASTDILQNQYGMNGECILTEEGGFVTYQVNVEQSGYYALQMEYFPIASKKIDIEKEVQINGELPYFEARDLILNRNWTDECSVRENYDQNGNEMSPKQIEIFDWITDTLKDGGGYYSDPMLFYLEKGLQEIKIVSLRESAAVRKMELIPKNILNSYNDVLKSYESEVSDHSKKSELVCLLEAEEPTKKSSPMLTPTYDRSSPFTSPYNTKVLVLNMIGGTRYKIPGQWLEYEIDIPEDGLYKIGFRARQNTLSGAYSSRKLMIDGKVPFSEAENIRFDYSTSWQMISPQYEGKDCLFHLTAGKHTLRLEATLGDMTKYLETVESSLTKLNKAYRQILTITGPTPDLYRDYYFTQEIPEVFSCFEEQQQILAQVRTDLIDSIGYRGENLAIFTKLDFLFNKVLKEPASLVKQLDNLETYIGALGTWDLIAREQPLDLDVIYIGEENYSFPKAEAGFFRKLGHEFKMFLNSFFTDFNSIQSGNESDEKSITVWTSASRDYVNILRRIIDDDFTPKTGIVVNLQLVAPGALLPSVLAQIGPDVALSVSSSDVMNFAARGAIADLSGFPDIEEVKGRFKPSAIVPMAYNNGFYGLPETQTFPVMFYRKDVLAEMGLSVPKTWDDVYIALREIQKRNMTFGLKTGMSSYSMFLFQMGGGFYKENNRFSNVASDLNVSALRMQTDMFISYQLPQKYDFANRFRTGEMPIGIEDYTTYNLLSVFAPEIKGLWGFAEVPGVLREDGTVNHSASSAVTASVIMSDTKVPELAYDFISWLTSTDTQIQYGREAETILGTAGRYNSANVEAVKGLAWHSHELKILESQWDQIQGIPEVPGGYYTGRYMDFAFRDVVLQGQLPREVMMEYEDIINEEMSYKRLEFGLD